LRFLGVAMARMADGADFLFERVRPYIPAGLIAVLIFYFGVNALTGDRGVLTHARRDAMLAARTHELESLRAEHARLQTEARLMGDDNLSRDLLEERAHAVLGFADRRDYVVRSAN
jgi:cell division protein FtsB